MASHRPFGVVGRHPQTVVTNPDQGDTATFYLHLHARRARVERVLDEFFYRRGRALYYLAGSDPVNYLRRQEAYLALGVAVLRWRFGENTREELYRIIQRSP